MKLAAPTRPARKTIFGLSLYADPLDHVNDVPRIELTLDTSLDWNWYRATLIYGAVLYAMRRLKNAPVGSIEAASYQIVVVAFSEMLHRIGDFVSVDTAHGPMQAERTFDWTSALSHQEIITDLNDWARTGVPRYRVAASSQQWEPLGNANLDLRDNGQETDAALFEAAFCMEWHNKPTQRTSARGVYKGLQDLCKQSQREFSAHEQMFPFVRPLGALSRLLDNITERSHGPHFVLSLDY